MKGLPVILGVIVFAMIVAPLCLPKDRSQLRPKVMLCNVFAEEPPKQLPKGWRKGWSNLRSFLNCDGKFDASKGFRINRNETYLAGLQHPGGLFRVDLQKKEGEKIGFMVVPKIDYLEVEKLTGAGTVSRWNTKHPPLAIKAKDRIISINGIEGNGTIMANELRSSANRTSLRIFRVSKEDLAKAAERKAQMELQKIINTKPPPEMQEGILEPPDSRVIVLHARNLEKYIEKQPIVLVMFYAAWCGHCQQVAPAYTKASKWLAEENLPVDARIAKFNDGDPVNSVISAGHENMYNFSSYPAMILFKDGEKKYHIPDSGPHEIVAALRAVAMDKDIDAEVDKALLVAKPKLYEPDGIPSDVVYDLEPDNFDDVVLAEYPENNAVWVVEFYSDTCPFCKSLKPEIIQASKEMQKSHNGKIRLGAVNSRAFPDIAKRFGVTTYPWIITVYANRKITDMTGLGGAETIVRFGTTNYDEVWREKPKWSQEPILVPQKEETDDNKRGTEELNNFANSTGSWRELLGRRTWFFLHTVAAKYPEKPTQEDKDGIRHLFSALGQHYPCPICRKHLQAKLVDPAVGPIPVKNRQELAIWVCKLHNLVNEDLGKVQQPCNAFQLDLMYLKSCGECSADPKKKEDEGEEVAEWDISRYWRGELPPPKQGITADE